MGYIGGYHKPRTSLEGLILLGYPQGALQRQPQLSGQVAARGVAHPDINRPSRPQMELT